LTEPRIYTLNRDEIALFKATDIYFLRSKEILQKKRMCKSVRYEFHVSSLPRGYKWAVYAGLEEVIALLRGKKGVTLYSLPEGTIFREMQPLAVLEGDICDVIDFETTLLGILRFYSTVATKAARIKKLAGEKTVLFFGLRATHPAVAPALDRAAFIGGVDAVSGAYSREFLGVEPQGTMPHALIIAFGNPEEAWKAFDEVMPPSVPRIALVDTFYDEREEALMAAQTLGRKLYGVRLDTPKSRRGDMKKIVEEVRWTLKLHGHNNVKIFVSGGIDEEQIVELRDLVDGFGVGTSIVNAPSIDISADIVEVFDENLNSWRPITKRGKLPGMKQLYRCKPIIEDYVDVWNTEVICRDGSVAKPMLKPYVIDGELAAYIPSPKNIREYVLEQLKQLDT